MRLLEDRKELGARVTRFPRAVRCTVYSSKSACLDRLFLPLATAQLLQYLPLDTASLQHHTFRTRLKDTTT